MAELEAQTRKMAQELAEYKSESTELRNQDHTVRRLEERVRSLEAELGEKVGMDWTFPSKDPPQQIDLRDSC